jgi:hypothetical protein
VVADAVAIYSLEQGISEQEQGNCEEEQGICAALSSMSVVSLKADIQRLAGHVR